MATKLKEINFTVDAELLRELGERLVGRQYIALAELIKNSYDADATKVEIKIRDDLIEVSDNGHGMTGEDFRRRWMRVGSTHKTKQARSPELGRSLTGSKGVGRLAVQFLASEIELCSVPKSNRLPKGETPSELFALVDWDTAVQAGELTRAVALYDFRKPDDVIFPQGASHGTKVKLQRLKHEWTANEFEELAREIWFLQPPFRSLAKIGTNGSGDFEVHVDASDSEVAELFNSQMARIVDLYSSRLVGKLILDDREDEPIKTGRVSLALQLESEDLQIYRYDVPVRDDAPCLIDELEFEIRIFTLQRRQPYGIRVQQARDYLGMWGGVHIYDGGFRIPLGGPAADWLNLEFDHAHRLTQSKLLPQELNVRMGLNYLPTNSRVLGIVNIDTANEARAAAANDASSYDFLQMQVSRDRLVINDAFHQLQDAVRFALDYYANRLTVLRNQQKEADRNVGSPTSVVEDVRQVLERYENEIPKPIVSELRSGLEKTIGLVREQSEWSRRQSGLLGAMATAGATAIAFDHQFNQQLRVLESYITQLDQALSNRNGSLPSVEGLIDRIRTWVTDVRQTRMMFLSISDERNRDAIQRFRAKSLIENMASNLAPILRGVNIDATKIDSELLLPSSSYAVWMAIFHNIFLNAYNAVIDSDVKRIVVSSGRDRRQRLLHVQDTGVGLDVAKSEEMFEPLRRGLDISSERRALGYGGTGLGLAIVRMLALDLDAETRFVEPEPGYKTCFELKWREESLT